MKNEKLPQFQPHFLAPKYWGFWLGMAIWRSLLLLPYPILRHIGNGLGWLFSKLKVGKRRAAIARRNLELCFPEMPEQEREAILQENLRAVGMAIIETGMAWFWSDARIKKWSKIEGLNYLKENAQDGIIFVGVHFLTLELGARIVGLHHPGIGVYRPNDNPVLDWLQIKGRLRSNKDMLNRKDLRGMFKALRKGETIWYAPDHDYGRKMRYLCLSLLYKKRQPRRGVIICLNPHQIAKSCLLPHYVIKMVQAIRSAFRHQWIFLIFQMKRRSLHE